MKKLNHYNIIKQIGKGGMGEVYLAQDTKLKRKVALKLLSSEFTNKKELLGRFEQEALAVSSLNHPNILTIYEIGKTKDTNFISTEFVNGVTLREKFHGKSAKLDDVLNIATQMASALDAAHGAGIIHRDIKPENVMIRDDGIVKILDFGLAKLTEKKTIEHLDPEATTVAKIETLPGMIMGTPQYMSPEQAYGEEIDERTDIFSLGIVLYEMIAGRLPFTGESLLEIIGSILRDEPKPLNNPEIPTEIKQIVAKTLKKDKTERYQTAKDLLVVLKSARKQLELQNKLVTLAPSNKADSKTQILNTTTLDDNEPNLTQTRKPDTERDIINQPKLVKKNIFRQIKTYKFGAKLIFAIFFVSLIGFSYWYSGGIADNLNSSSFFDSVEISSLTSQGKASRGIVSPDGKLVAFIETEDNKQKLVVRQISTGGRTDVVPPTSKGILYRTTFSPNGEYIYYVSSNDEGVRVLYSVPTLGGKSKELVVDIDSKVSVSMDGKKLVFSRYNSNDDKRIVYIADNDGKNVKPLISTDDVGYSSLSEIIWSNDDKKIVLIGYKNTNESKTNKLSFTSVSTDEKVITSEIDEFIPFDKHNFDYVTDFTWFKDNSGLIFLGRRNKGDTLQVWHLIFSMGEFRQVTNDTSRYYGLSASDDMKTLVIWKVNQVAKLLAHNPETNRNEQIIAESKSFIGYTGISQMPNGKILYVNRIDNGFNIFSINEDGTTETQLTFESESHRSPIASPDGKYIVFSSTRSGNSKIWRMDSDGNNAFALTKLDDVADADPQISNDGKTVIFSRYKKKSKNRLMKVSIDGGKAIPLIPESKTNDRFPKISPDGKKIAYRSYSYDTQGKQIDNSLKIYELEGSEIGEFIDKLDWRKRGARDALDWTPDSKSIIFAGTSSKNLSSLSLESKKETPFTSFTTGMIWNFLISNNGERVFLVRGTLSSDLVLIRKKEKGL